MEEGGPQQQEQSSQRALSCPPHLPGTQPCCSRAGTPGSHCGDNAPGWPQGHMVGLGCRRWRCHEGCAVADGLVL